MRRRTNDESEDGSTAEDQQQRTSSHFTGIDDDAEREPTRTSVGAFLGGVVLHFIGELVFLALGGVLVYLTVVGCD